ncbi:hypothetical protein Tco_1164466 [Tanacetum coccineum]
MSTLAHSHLPRCRLPYHLLLLLRVLLLPQILLLSGPRLHPLRQAREQQEHHRLDSAQQREHHPHDREELRTDISQKDEKPIKKRQNRTRDGKVCGDKAKSNVFPDPILFLAGLKSLWEHGQQRPVILVGGKEMAFRNSIYTEDDEDLTFLPKEPSLGFGFGSPSVSVNTKPLKDNEEPEIQPVEIGSVKLEEVRQGLLLKGSLLLGLPPPVLLGTDIQEKNKKKAKSKQIRARNGKDKVKSQAK